MSLENYATDVCICKEAKMSLELVAKPLMGTNRAKSRTI